jgi:hypothetical protein
MGTKGVLAGAGVFVVGLALAGCESSRPYYEGPRSYVPPQMGSSFTQGSGGNSNTPPGGYYSSSGGYYNQPRSLPASTTTNVTTLSSAKTEPAPERHAASAEGGSSLQLVSGVASTANGSAPMLTITLPAVKLLVPVNGLYSFTPPAGAVAKTAQPEAAVVEHAPAPVSSAWPTESQPARAAVQSAPITTLYNPPPAQPPAYSQPAPMVAPMAARPAYCPPPATEAPIPATSAPAMLPEPTLQYSEPAVSTPASALQSSAPIMPSPMPLQLSTQAMPASLPNIPDDASQGARTATLPPPPPPTWPRPATVADDGLGADLSPPPSLPLRRGQPSNKVPMSPSGQNPYFQ